MCIIFECIGICFVFRMKSNVWFIIGLLGLLILFCIGCGEIAPLWKGGYELENYTHLHQRTLPV